jgi:hypothetical protein
MVAEAQYVWFISTNTNSMRRSSIRICLSLVKRRARWIR